VRSISYSAQIVSIVGRTLVGVAAAGIIGLALVTGWERMADSPRLQVRRIDAQGNHRTSDKEILAYAGAQQGAAIMRLDLDAMALRLRQHPWIAKATIRRQLPDRLHIHIKEHQPVLLVSLGDLYLANPQGQLFKRFEARDKVDVPVVTGIDREGAAKHNDEVAQRLRVAVQLAESIQEQRDDFGRLEELHWDEDLGWNIILQPDASTGADALVLRPGVRAQLGHNPAERLDRVASTLRVLNERHQVPDVIWADGDRTPDRVSVELLAERRASAAAAPAVRR
jgi:cell division septal protein FtsQ